MKQHVRMPLPSLVGFRLALALLCVGSGPLLGADLVATATAGADHPFSWVRFLAPFHMVVLHFPIGLISLVALFEIWAWRQPSTELRRVIQFTLTVTGLACVVTVTFGLLRAIGGEYEPVTLSQHRIWGLAAGAALAVTWEVHRRLVRLPSPRLLLGFRLLLFGTLHGLVIAAHQGGSLTHGSTFLTENAPKGIRRWLGETTESPSQTATRQSALTVAAQAVFQRKCIACHGPEKQKGQLRVDDLAVLRRGGKSGIPALVPGDPGKSYLIQLSLLPPGHDDVMPPDGKEPLNGEELMALVRWIQAGASP
jgi:mono/diheme cytochrome c family protein/uncharacterized membrane protein